MFEDDRLLAKVLKSVGLLVIGVVILIIVWGSIVAEQSPCTKSRPTAQDIIDCQQLQPKNR